MDFKKTIIKYIFNLVLTGLLLICLIGFLVGHFLDIEVLTGISASISVLLIPVMSLQVLLKEERLNIYDWILLYTYYVLAICFLVLLLPKIKETELKEVLIPMASTAMGGFITLLGVGISIKYSRIDKKEEEIKKCKPRVFPISESTLTCLKNIIRTEIETAKWNGSLKKASNNGKNYQIRNLFLGTSDLSMCTYDGIIVDDDILWFDEGIVLLKNQNYNLIHNICFKGKRPKEIWLLLTDMLENTYKIQACFDIKENIIFIHSVRKTEMFIQDNFVD